MEIPTPLENNKRVHETYYAVIATNNTTGKLYADLTGRFPVQSSKGNNYLLVAYHYDSNNILATPLKNCTGPEIGKAHQTLHQQLKDAGLVTSTIWLDN